MEKNNEQEIRTPEQIGKEIAETTIKLNQLIKEGVYNDLNIVLKVDNNEYLLQRRPWNEYIDLYVSKEELIYRGGKIYK